MTHALTALTLAATTRARKSALRRSASLRRRLSASWATEDDPRRSWRDWVGVLWSVARALLNESPVWLVFAMLGLVGYCGR